LREDHRYVADGLARATVFQLQGFDAYLHKPVDNLEPVALIARLAGRKKAPG
jgi:hypothetical protein